MSKENAYYILIFVEGLVNAPIDTNSPSMPVAGRKHEMTTDGGEVSFVMKMVNDSKRQVMLGEEKGILIIEKVIIFKYWHYCSIFENYYSRFVHI